MQGKAAAGARVPLPQLFHRYLQDAPLHGQEAPGQSVKCVFGQRGLEKKGWEGSFCWKFRELGGTCECVQLIVRVL